MTNFIIDYLVMVFLSALGVLLIVTAYGRLSGLLLMGRRLSILVGTALILLAFAWFFVSQPRNLPDTTVGLDGNGQALLFVMGAGAALVMLLTISSLRNWSMDAETEGYGVEALRSSSYLRLLSKEVKERWNRWYGRMKQHSSG